MFTEPCKPGLPPHKVRLQIAESAIVSPSTLDRYLAGLGVRRRGAARIAMALVAYGFAHLVRVQP